MVQTAAEKQKAYRDRQKVTRDGNAEVTPVGNGNGNAPISVTELAALGVGDIGPLDVYSPRRWSYLQAHGYVWDQDKQRGIKTVQCSVQIGVVVPGDPVYERAQALPPNKPVTSPKQGPKPTLSLPLHPCLTPIKVT